ncbi:aminopeptidase P N-terminal domain-containing protein [Candidatus Saccharibacteria bacterium]|nr:MAG: aminopeptidase P N-terminal domain-containing protein [Candidatus Saccharibacteria bacterium]
MESYFTHNFFAGNRKRLYESMSQDGLCVVGAHGILQRSRDTTFPFAQDKNFWYLTGLDMPDAVLVMAGNREYLILPKRSREQDIFDGAFDLKHVAARSGLHELLDNTEGWRQLRADVKRYEVVSTLFSEPSYDRRHGVYVNPARNRLIGRLRRLQSGIALADIRPNLAELRMIKQPAEIAAVSQAVAITTRAIDAMRSSAVLAGFATEYEFEAALSQSFRAQGARGHAYDPIVASGSNATTLHYIANSAQLAAGQLIVVDVGAEVEEYAADITRTVACEQPTHRQQTVLAAVRDVQQYALTLLKPGVLLQEYEKKVGQKMATALVELGLISDATDTMSMRNYFPHATSHFLGLDVHDVGFYDRPLAAGVVLTCEPGIYIAEEGIGVRLEDDVLITESGHTNLSRDCSYDAYVI